MSTKNFALEKDKHPDKLRGGYYTPPAIAEWLCKWAITSTTSRILEPSCGDGVFMESAASRLASLGASPDSILKQLFGVEIIETEARKATERLFKVIGENRDTHIHSGDFFEWLDPDSNGGFNCVVGNPPFIRYQNFPEPSRSRAMSLLKEFGFRPNKLTNIWVPFVVGSTISLAPGGRLAMVLPAELLQVSYASQLRSFLVNEFQRIEILACNELIFDGAEQEVVLFLADNRVAKHGLGRKCRINLNELSTLKELLSSNVTSNQEKAVNHESEKWLKYFLTAREISLMRELRSHKDIVNLGKHASIDVGVVTGRNDFFVLSKEQVERLLLGEYVSPLIGRSYQLKGALINKSEWRELSEDGHRVFLFNTDSNERRELPMPVKRYISSGEDKGIHDGYKCSIRSPWYKVPSAWIPDCFFFRQIYDFPRIVLNRAKATSTDTIHRMKCRSSKTKLVSNLYTHLTAASAEIEGRSYGGGVLELEPTEAERLLVPKKLVQALPVEELDKLIRIGNLESALKQNDQRVLIDGLGLSKKDCMMLKRIWLKMRDRRVSRRRSRTK
jgi:adenine-specific DNA methylase